MSARMALDTLLAQVPGAAAAPAIEVSGLELDSRRVERGQAFVALRGLRHHGIEFAAQARARGAGVVLAEAPVPAGLDDPGPTVWIADLARHLGSIAARWYGQPGKAMRVIGVTGTNGKTSIVQLLLGACQRLARPAASIGTLGAGMAGHVRAGERTTPDAIRVQALLAEFRDAGADTVAMEVSSHALVQGRVNGVPFATAVFTNLGRDHLDYHRDIEAYFEAKARLFAWPTLDTAVVNVDDPRGRELLARIDKRIRPVTCGLDSAHADVRADALVSHADGFDFQLHTPWGSAPVPSRLLGRFNVANLLAVVACLGTSGVPFEAICRVLPRLDPVRGRMQAVPGSGGSRPAVVVDYAHTPDALQAALSSLRPHTRRRLVCVFGAGGERDAGKRPQMGAVAAAMADRIIVTDDNPRGEDGDAIVADILRGLAEPGAATVIRDRHRAIATAIGQARAGDVVLVAGKGHETRQEDARGTHGFDDLGVAASVLAGAPGDAEGATP